MLCQNCGKNEANIKYTQIINGVKKQMTLCSNCAKELGVEDIGFNMPINFSSFLGDMFEDTTVDFMPNIINTKSIICDKCNMTYDEFAKIGKFGCEYCYETFENKIDSLLKSIQGSNRHVGTFGKGVIENKINNKDNDKLNNKENVDEEKNNKENEIKKLEERLKQEIKEERYEDAAKTRDEIKQLQGK